MGHNKNHSFTGMSDHDFTGLVANQILEFNGTDIASLNTATAGTILYVSSDGDDSTAVKGDSLRPYANIYAAKSASTSGDTIYVLPHTIVYDNRDTAGNPYNGQIETLINLWKNGVTYYFSPDTRIIFYNQTVTGENMYLFNPGGTTGETCTVLGGLEYEQFSTGVDSSNGANHFYFNDNGFDSTFYSETHKLTSHHCELINVNMPSASFSASNTSVTIKSDYEYRDYLGGQTSSGAHYFFRSDYGVVSFNADTKYREIRYSGYAIYTILANKDSTINIYGKKLICEPGLFLMRGGLPTASNENSALFNVSVDDIYYGTSYTPFSYYGSIVSTYSKGGWTLNLNANLYDLEPNSYTTALFVVGATGGACEDCTINFKGDITTNTSSGVGRYIASASNNRNEVNIDGNIRTLGTGTTTQIFFQAIDGDSVVNYTGKITGNYASTIARPRNGGTVNLNNVYIESNVDGSGSNVFSNNTTNLGTCRLNNSYVRLTNNTNGVVDGEDNNIFINNSTVINLGTGSTVAYNTTNNGDLQVVNSTLISSYSAATSIAYTGSTTVIATNSTVNTNYDINDFKGNINILTDLTY